MNRAEGDRVCGMVLTLVRELARISSLPRLEPTGVVYHPSLSEFVEKRSDHRKAS